MARLMLRRTAAVLLSLSFAGGLSACGNKEDEITKAESEALYLDVADLKYQVQISRQLNPADVEDSAYLKGLSAVNRILPANSVWFGVFMRVENESEETHETAEEFAIEDTQGNEFEPVEVDNPLAYSPTSLPPKGLLPSLNSVQYATPSQGALLLFKIPYASLDNRPLELKVTSPDDKTGLIDLDV